MKHFIKILFFILVPYFAFSQSLGKNAGKTRLAPTTQLRKGTKPNQILMTRQSDTSLVYSDLDTILQNNIRNTDTYNTFSIVNDSVRIQKWKLDTATNVFVTSNLNDVYLDNLVNKPSVDSRVVLDVVNDSLKVEVWDIINNTLLSTYYIDNVGNHAETVTTLTNTIPNGNLIGTYTNEAGAVVNIKETLTSYNDQTTSTPHLIGKYLDEFGNLTDINETLTSLNSTLSTGHLIGQYVNEDNVGVTIKESIIGVVNNADGSATITKENGTTVTTTPFHNTNFSKINDSLWTHINLDGTIDTIIVPVKTVDTDTKHLFSIVGDSIRIDSFNNKSGVIIGSPQFIDDVINKPDLVQSAANDLRVSGTTIVRGSDDPANAKGSEFTSDIYNHMAGFDDSWIGAYGSARPIQKIFNNGTIEFSTNGNHATELSMHYTQGAMAIGQGNVYYYPYTFIIGRNNLVTNDYNLVNGLFSTINSSGVLSSGAHNETSAGSSYVTLSGIIQKALGASTASFSSGQGNTMTDSRSSFSTGENHDNTGDFQFTQGYDQRNNTYNGILLGSGNHYSWTGQSKASWVNTDYHVRLNRGTAANPIAAQSSLVILKNGFTQINTDLNSNSSHTQSQVTPVSALDVVSTTAGFQAPRMTEAELNTYLSTFNLTTDITGGANGVAYCKIGMEVICTDCTALDGSTTGVKVNLYPNAAQTAWIAKKSH